MLTFLDRWLSSKLLYPQWTQEGPDSNFSFNKFIKQLREDVPKAEAVEAGNVAEYMYAGTAQEFWQFPDDFPLLMPPYRRMMIGLTRPSAILSDAELTPGLAALPPEKRLRAVTPKQWGVYVQSETVLEHMMRTGEESLKMAKTKEMSVERLSKAFQSWSVRDQMCAQLIASRGRPEIMPSIISQLTPANVVKLAAEGVPAMLQDRDLFVCSATLFACADDWGQLDHTVGVDRNAIVGPLMILAWLVDKHGVTVGSPVRSAFTTDMKEATRICDNYAGLMHPAYMAISFMNTKNIVVREQKPDEKLSKARTKRGHKPLVSYHVIEIEGVRELVRKTKDEAGKPISGLKKALHAIRGHFKDYRAGKGLFGRTKGLFWWQENTVGDPDAGAVVKDYDISKKE